MNTQSSGYQTLNNAYQNGQPLDGTPVTPRNARGLRTIWCGGVQSQCFVAPIDGWLRKLYGRKWPYWRTNNLQLGSHGGQTSRQPKLRQWNPDDADPADKLSEPDPTRHWDARNRLQSHIRRHRCRIAASKHS